MSTNSRLKQCSIVTLVRNMKTREFIKKQGKIVSPLVIEIEDSEDENAEENLCEKRHLPVPLDSDYDSEPELPEEGEKVTKEAIPTSDSPVESKMNKLNNEVKPKLVIGVNKPKSQVTKWNPRSHSTPIKGDTAVSQSYSNTPSHMESLFTQEYVSLQDITNLANTSSFSNIEENQVSDSKNSENLTDSENTIICESEQEITNNVNSTIKVINNIVLTNGHQENSPIAESLTISKCVNIHDNLTMAFSNSKLKCKRKIFSDSDDVQSKIGNRTDDESESKIQKIKNNVNHTPKKRLNFDEQSSQSKCSPNSSSIEISPIKNITFDDDSSPGTSKTNSSPNSSPKKATPKKRKSLFISPASSPSKKGSLKKEEKKINFKPLELLKNLFKEIYLTSHLKDIVEDDAPLLRTFLTMNHKYQYFCLKLFTWKPKWYNIYKFCEKIALEFDDKEVVDLYYFLVKNNIVDSDYSKEDPRKLLNYLDRVEVKNVYSSFRLKKTVNSKEGMIDQLLKNCTTQSTLTFELSTSDLLNKHIIQNMGKCIKMKQSVRDCLYRLYLLATFPNPDFSIVTDYFKNMLGLGIVFPEYKVEEYAVFLTRNDFLNFAEARKCKNELIEAAAVRKHTEVYQICKYAFGKLREFKRNQINPTNISHLSHHNHFRADYVYASAITSGMVPLTTKYPEEVKDWLEYLIDNMTYKHRLGDWYNQLIWIYMRYSKPPDYGHAADLMIKVLQQQRDHLSEVQLHELGERGRQLRKSKKIVQVQKDSLAELLPKELKHEKYPTLMIDAKTKRDNEMGMKRNYFDYDSQGDIRIMSVEEVARKHYINQLGYTNGLHCEGSIVTSTFTLFFYDLIYNEYVPGTFISNLQSVPLDMCGQSFYLNRKDGIDKRLKEIYSEWSDERFIKFAKDNWRRHSHEAALVVVDACIGDEALLETVILCIGRKVLAKIYERLVRNYRRYRSGMPDLLLWNVDRKKSKFVEVKGENDKLSIKQKLWIEYLLKEAKADVEVCHVHSIGSKKKVLVKNNHSKAGSSKAE